jgi:hypothetical protein
MILKKERCQGYMFHYFFVKSFNDFILFIVNQCEWVIFCEDCSIKDSYFSQILLIYCWWYMEDVCLLASGFLELAATLDCYNLLSKKFDCLQVKSSIYKIVCSIYILASIYLIPVILKQKVVKTYIGYKTVKLEYKIYDIHFIAMLAIRNVLTVFLLLILNFLILLKMKNLTKTRRNNFKNKKQTHLVVQAERA